MQCPECRGEVEFHRFTCRICGTFVNYPNVRKATGMRGNLEHHYAAAVADAERRGVRALLDTLEFILSHSTATINMHTNVFLSMCLGTDYRAYHHAYDDKLRRIAEEKYHRHRSVVDAGVHPGYFQDIVYAVISPDGRGLTNYGEITLRLDERTIVNRASVLRENAFDFFQRYHLDHRDAVEEPGWRCIWSDRGQLGVAHLTTDLTTATSIDALPAMILTVGSSRHSDRFMEVHIHGELALEAVGSVSLDQPLTRIEAQGQWALARQMVAARGIPVEDRVSP